MKVIRAGGGFNVQSSQSDKYYSVELDPPSCTCPSFQFRSLVCKHIGAVRSFLRNEENEEIIEKELLAFVKERGGVSRVILEEKFTAETIDRMLRLGGLVERDGEILLL